LLTSVLICAHPREWAAVNLALLASASFRPATISPTADGQADVTEIDYTLRAMLKSPSSCETQPDRCFTSGAISTHSRTLFSAVQRRDWTITCCPTASYAWVIAATGGQFKQEHTGTLTIY